LTVAVLDLALHLRMGRIIAKKVEDLEEAAEFVDDERG
jgi:hypothetical protein